MTNKQDTWRAAWCRGSRDMHLTGAGSASAPALLHTLCGSRVRDTISAPSPTTIDCLECLAMARFNMRMTCVSDLGTTHVVCLRDAFLYEGSLRTPRHSRTRCGVIVENRLAGDRIDCLACLALGSTS